MICSPDAIASIAGRIERAYLRRHPRWAGCEGIEGAWEQAATRLLEASGVVTYLPVDPELYVAVLAAGGSSPDPWLELTRRGSRVRYLKVVRRIIGRLRRELEAEMRLARCRLNGGMVLDDLLDDAQDRISPLTRYTLAYQAGRIDLVLKHRAAAGRQNESCPLYREACREILPGHAYPFAPFIPDPQSPSQDILIFSLN